jgi:hypothetical protein
MEVAVMSLSAREKHALDSIESCLVSSDPYLASMLNTFTRLAAGEDMPAREKIRPGCRPGPQSRRTGDRPRRLVRRLGRPQAAVLVWLIISVVLLATALALDRGGRGGGRGACAASFAAACGRPAQTHRTGPSAVSFVPGTRSLPIWLR